MEVERDIGSVHFIAFFVGALKFFFNFNCESPIFLPIFQFVESEVILLQVLGHDYFLLIFP